MSSTEDAVVEATGEDPGYYENAKEYALARLDEESPTSPSELADEYDCTGDHMRKTLAELAEDGVVDRVSRGNYTLDDAVEGGKDVLSDAADTATDALDQFGEEDTDVDEIEEAPGPVLPMEPKKLGMLLAAALVLWLIYDNLYGGVDTDVETSDLEEEQDGGDEDGGLGGGLVG